jgi:hypothetical protein
MLARGLASQGASREHSSPGMPLSGPVRVVRSAAFERALAWRWLTPRRFRHPPPSGVAFGESPTRGAAGPFHTAVSALRHRIEV